MVDKQNPPEPGGGGNTARPLADVLSKFGDPTQLVAAAAQQSANSVQVSPGGKTFPTIGAALASITDASLRKQYLITAGPGTYNEQVILKPYVYLHGSGIDQTTVTAPPVSQDNFVNRGTIVGASNSAVANLTASCLGGNWADYSTALLATASMNFLVEEVALVCDDQGHAGINMETVAINWNAQPIGPSQVYISYSTITATETGDSGGTGLIVNGQANVQCIETKIIATGSSGTAAASNGGAT
ncbi:MAG TPA: hypothetical protein VGB98_08105, partial [Pyrinomonadaceae bacterium]